MEDNTIVGNSNGIYLQPTAVTNIFRRNLVMGNPPIQVAVNNPASNGFDIWNLSPAGANTFQANVCLTSVNAPCPASAPPSLSASPNPIPVTGAAVLGMTTISWMAPGAEAVEVRIGSPNGALFASGDKPLTAENTLATVVVRLQRR